MCPSFKKQTKNKTDEYKNQYDCDDPLCPGPLTAVGCSDESELYFHSN